VLKEVSMMRFFLLVFLAISSGFAGERSLVRYFFQLGSNMAIPAGGFDGKSVVTLDTDVDTSLTPESVSIPKLPVFPEITGRLGVFIDAHSLTMGIGMGRPMIVETPDRQPFPEQHAEWLAFQVEYQYNFRYPEVWRPSFGVSYGFARLGLTKNSISEEEDGNEVGDVLFSGTGPGIVAGIGWYPTWNFCVKAELRSRYYNMKNLTTTANDFSALDDGINLWITDLGVSALFIF
jgi:hypothetical protein